MDANSLKNLLNENDIYNFLSELGAEPKFNKNQIISRTICHGGHKHKLIYYIDSKTFTCYTGNCGKGFDLFSLVGKVYGMDFPSSFKYICGKFGINSSYEINPIDIVDTSFIKKFEQIEQQDTVKEIDTKLLNNYYKLYHKDWMNDGISKKTMIKFNILFSIRENKIIIPHFDYRDRLIGIRGRALNFEEIEAGKKYMPVFCEGKVRNFPTGASIYGLNVTKQAINRYKTVILFEAEKSVLQLDTMLPNFSIGGSISGSSLSNEQVKILQKLGVENVVIGLDKEFKENKTEEEIFYKKKIASGFIDKLIPYFHVSVLWDKKGLLPYKASPTDKGLDVFMELWKNRILI